MGMAEGEKQGDMGYAAVLAQDHIERLAGRLETILAFARAAGPAGADILREAAAAVADAFEAQCELEPHVEHAWASVSRPSA